MDTLLKYLVYAVTILVVLALLLGAAILLKRKKQTNGSSSRDEDSPGWFTEYKQYLWTILLVLGGGGVVLWLMYHPISLADAVQWRSYWFPLLIFWSVGAILIALNAKVLGAAAKTLQWLLAGAIGMLFIVLPVVNYFWGEKSPSERQQAQAQARPQSRASDDCTYARPCTNPVGPNGSTEKVRVPVGKGVCFDPPVWADQEGFGFLVSSQGEPERSYGCTPEQILQKECKEKPPDTFRFVPQEGKIPPRHWFSNGGLTC